jgi:hypothetical protein
MRGKYLSALGFRRMRRKYLSAFGEYVDSIEAYMKNMANWGYLRYTKSSPNTRKVFKRIRRMRGKNLCVHGEDAKRLLAYSFHVVVRIRIILSYTQIRIQGLPIRIRDRIRPIDVIFLVLLRIYSL